MAATQLKEMDIRHHAILNWMLLNPGRCCSIPAGRAGNARTTSG